MERSKDFYKFTDDEYERFLNGEEIWRDVVGWENLYQVSTEGRIKRLPKKIIRNNGWVQTFNEKILSLIYDKDGYTHVGLSHLGLVKKYKVHRLEAEAFISEVGNLQINHINGIRDYNHLSNIEICNCSENMRHSYRVLGRKIKGVVVDNNKPVIAYKIKDRKSQKCDAIIDCEFARFNSVVDASIKIGIDKSGIGKSANGTGQKTAGGFIWRYVEKN